MKIPITFIRRHFLWIAFAVLLVLLASAFELGRYSVYRAHPELTNSEQAQALLSKVSLLIPVPPSETPTMATIQDADRAKQGQPFLVNAQNGDVLIIYANAAEAILYRPSANKIINVGPVNTGTPSNTLPNPAPVALDPTPSSMVTHATSPITSPKKKK